MFQNYKRNAICMVIETILPWLVLISGVPAIDYFAKSSDTYNGGNYGPEYLEYSSLYKQNKREA